MATLQLTIGLRHWINTRVPSLIRVVCFRGVDESQGVGRRAHSILVKLSIGRKNNIIRSFHTPFDIDILREVIQDLGLVGNEIRIRISFIFNRFSLFLKNILRKLVTSVIFAPRVDS